MKAPIGATNLDCAARFRGRALSYDSRGKALPVMTSTFVETWRGPFTSGDYLINDDSLTLVVNTSLREGRSAAILVESSGTARVAVRPEVARSCGWDAANVPSSLDQVREGLAANGVILNDPDCIFGFAGLDLSSRAGEADGIIIRELNENDAAAFSQFVSHSSEDDVDEAFVELDHWLVMGLFAGDQLASASSAYPWGETKAADIGILTAEDQRGKGYGSLLVNAISHAIRQRGYEPQYRCQLENVASAGTARASGFELFGMWEIAELAQND